MANWLGMVTLPCSWHIFAIAERPLLAAVMCRALGRPNRLSRMILLTPAGFHFHYPAVSTAMSSAP